MISIAMHDKVLDVISVNKSYDKDSDMHSIWAVKSETNASLKIYESADKKEVDMRFNMIVTAINEGDYLADLRE